MAALPNKDKIKQPSSNLFPVVGVGASAGGLDAFKRLLKAIPSDSGMAFILVQHLEPTHESLLTSLLQKVTNIPVQEITDNVQVEPNHIYIIPSNRLLTATDGILQLSPRPPRSEKNMPIDVFFKSLAEVHESHAIGIILSGTASDGTLGLKAIKDHGGITFAQDQESAAYDAMPQSAIDADVVDFILAPEDIALQLSKLNQTFNNDGAGDEKELQLTKEDTFRQILSLLRVRKGTDFTYYKQTTIHRRIIRRMGLNKIESVLEYHLFLKKNKQEQDILYLDLLIPVTDFFRDKKTFDTLCEKIFPSIAKKRESNNPLRIWVAGCSTGEEAYSIAMCLHDYLGAKATDIKIQIFATDISEKSITKARSGMYTKKDITHLSAEHLEKYFIKVNGGFQVNRFIRDMCVFATHNFLKDPPFAKMDLISCRNVLIYMEAFLQKKALVTFHYALNENGYLLLGKSETVSPAADLFTVFSKNEKIYVRKAISERFLHSISMRNEKLFEKKVTSTAKEPAKDDFQKNADDILLSKYTPAGVVINDQMEIVQFRGSTGTWLEPSPGKPNLNLLKMAREGLAFELRNALHKAKIESKPFIKENVPLQFMGQQQLVTIEVIPLLKTADPYYLILFNEVPLSTERHLYNAPSSESKQSVENARIQMLENELALARENMRSITEDQEAINEELQSANEELLSGSEELQSLNEELETSKEEIQSTNEELTTLNQELFDRNEQLNIARIYAESIIATVREPLIILDKNLVVKSANNSYYKKFRTSEEETEGKSFFEIGDRQWNIPALRSLLDKILYDEKKITSLEINQEFKAIGERIMLLNANRIFIKDNTEQLVLVAIEDVTEIKRIEAEKKDFMGKLEQLVSERTVELETANKLLKHSNENLEQFAAIASHDLQEPLRKIRTFANILNRRHSNEIKGQAKELINKINLSAERMSMLIKDVLNISRIIDSENVFEKTDLNQIMQFVIDDFDLLIKEKTALITYDELPIIEAIPLQINQLFYNLISNALKFSKPRVVPIINITCKNLTSADIKSDDNLNINSSYCEIIFSDNGIGFDKQFSEQIFLIFQRLHSKEQFEGTGIGLALCKKIVVNHHGAIYADSGEREGTQFRVILPLKQ
ncbi:CheR family methyltransferase [Ferruginibacter albus]|uniref:CheR family methyltransferase n=1 Tax=Ferruginibacter albus TaxID=2875540 RepID=UPI001CC42613|nr:CheR family methyltransferase [Ferruginibacter albus]UAY53092.1 PAS domain-containing protein [Ferruginibacter albus]